MASPLEKKVRSVATEYVDGQISLKEFYERLSQIVWDLGFDAPESELAHGLYLHVVEYGIGAYDEAELKRLLKGRLSETP